MASSDAEHRNQRKLCALTILANVTADSNGEVSLTPTVSAGSCGWFIQAADVTTCTPSNVAQVP